MSVYSLINLASYSASIGYGITTAVVGVILTGTRILDGVTDPMLAFVYDRVNTKWGKLRVLLVSGFLIEAVGLLLMFNFLSSKGFGWLMFTFLYVIYVIGYTITNMTAQTIPAIMTNDPSTPAIFWLTMGLKFGLPIIGWIITLVAMRFCPLDKQEMVNVQKRIAEKKAALNPARLPAKQIALLS